MANVLGMSVSSTVALCHTSVTVSVTGTKVQAWFALDPQRFRALLPASWDDLALVSGWVLVF